MPGHPSGVPPLRGSPSPGYVGPHAARLPGRAQRASRPHHSCLILVSGGRPTSPEQQQEQEQKMPGLRPEDSSPGLGPTILAKSNDGAGIQHEKRVIRESRSSGLEDHRPPEPPWGPQPALVRDGT